MLDLDLYSSNVVSPLLQKEDTVSPLLQKQEDTVHWLVKFQILNAVFHHVVATVLTNLYESKLTPFYDQILLLVSET